MNPSNGRDILLIEPPFYRLFKESYSLHRYPLSLGYLAGAIEKNTDWNVQVLNADFQPDPERMKVGVLGAEFETYLDNLRQMKGRAWEELRSTLAEQKPRVVGISAKSQNFASALQVAKLVKEADPETIVILGGPHPSMVGADVLEHPEVDISVVGEGEQTIVELLDAIADGKDLAGIEGIIYRKDGRIVQTPRRELIADLDSLGFPHETAARVLINYDQYPVEAFANVFATRGCPHSCFFCGSREIWSRKVRFRSPENVIEEIKSLKQLGVDSIHFDDDTFGVNRKYLDSLCGAIVEQCPDLKWSCETHVKLVDDRTISQMKQAGCQRVQVGIESGSDTMLTKIRKGITIEEARDACRTIKKHGIDLEVFFIVGFPEETEETLRETVAAIKRIPCDNVVFSIFTPYPGTEAFEFCREHGLVGDEFDVSLYNHQSPANSFCVNIQPAAFKAMSQKLAKMVDRQNSRRRAKRITSLRTFKRIRELGFRKSFKKCINLLIGKM